LRKSKRGNEHTALWLIFGGAAALTLFVVILYGANKWYRHWQAQRFARRAQTYASWGDNKSASLTARKVLEFEPKNLEALRTLADVSERQGLSGTIELRKQIVTDHPDSTPDAIALAKTALKFGAIETAESALKRVAGKAEGDSGYHEALGQMAVVRKQFSDAEKEFKQALEVDRSNPTLSLELGGVQLRSSDATVREDGRKQLEALLNTTALRSRAAKMLLDNAIERKDSALVHFAELLSSYPETSFLDRLLCLQLFQQLQLPQFASALTALQERAPANSEDLTSLIAWMSTNSLSYVALEWVKHLPPETLMKPPVFVAVGDCYIATRDCAGLKQWCNKGSWQTLEFLRNAYLARAYRDCNDSLNADLEWSKAVKGAERPEDLQTLQRAAARWDWKKESIDLLWSVAKSEGAKQKAALDTLSRYYAEQGDTASLYRVAARLSRVAPDDPQVQNNFAQLSLLLNADMDHARGVARHIYEEHRSDANFASTYAFALFTQRLSDEAVKVMSALAPEELKRPEIAAYYGIVLAGAGARDKAQPYLELGKTAHLLPEEKKLLDEAIAR
jgi:Flp pilus assembly protein TadD